jgi:hypothetical protein
MINAFHINSTAPFFINNKREYHIEDFDILTTILSALMWRKLNGRIKLYTDKIGKDYYASIGLLDLWDAGVDTTVLENMPETINQQIFWASAKIFALQAEVTPVAMLDTDLIVWQNLSSILHNKPFAVIHREKIFANIYLPPDKLKKREDYQFDSDWDWTELPCNMSFAYFTNSNLKKYYTDCSIDFMLENDEYPKEMISQMVFAEQRIISMCAKKMNISIYHFLDDPFQLDNQLFTHIWGAKEMTRNDSNQRRKLCTCLILKIKEYFPEYFPELSKMKMFKSYIINN